MLDTQTTGRQKPLDRRVKRTRQAIKTSFLELAKDRPVDQITVKEVMGLADVNRATFYAHFSNISDLVSALEEDVAAAVIQDAEHSVGSSTDPTEVADAIFSAIISDAQIFDWLVSPNSTGRAKKLICEYARTRCVINWTQDSKLDRDEADCLFDFLFEGCFGILNRWSAGSSEEASVKAKATLHSLIGATLTVLD